MHLREKIFSHKVYLENNKMVNNITLFGINFKFTDKEYLFNAKSCHALGIKTILFVRDDGIGDFIFDVPYIKYMKKSVKYKGYKLILAGTPNIVEIAKKYLSEYIDEYIVLKFKNKRQLKKFSKKLSFTTVINPIDAKLNATSEILIKTLKANEKICHKGFFANHDIQKFGQKITDRINNYTKIIDTGEKIMLVKDRCKLFFELLLDENLPKAEWLCDMKGIEPDISSDYVIISPFARDDVRIYSAQNFATIIDYITNNLELPVIILGGENERTKTQEIIKLCSNQEMIYNMAGKFSLSESILYIKNAVFMVANETGTVHIAQNYKVKTIAISNGSFMNTFQPYPKEESYITYVYPDNIQEFIFENNSEGYRIDYDINKISPNKVIDAINQIINAGSFKKFRSQEVKNASLIA